jgi:hypothetical protein
MSEEPYLKMYIAVLDEFPSFMVPTLVAHSVLAADMDFTDTESVILGLDKKYLDWKKNSFKKVVLKVNQKEFDKIKSTIPCYAGHENNTLGGKKSCLVTYPVYSNKVPNVLKFAKLWKPD